MTAFPLLVPCPHNMLIYSATGTDMEVAPAPLDFRGFPRDQEKPRRQKANSTRTSTTPSTAPASFVSEEPISISSCDEDSQGHEC